MRVAIELGLRPDRGVRVRLRVELGCEDGRGDKGRGMAERIHEYVRGSKVRRCGLETTELHARGRLWGIDRLLWESTICCSFKARYG